MADPVPSANSYGTVEGVAAYAGLFTTDRVFTPGTNPTNATIVHWIDQVSSLLNAVLGKYGVVTPITAPKALPMCVALVEQYVSDMAQLANGLGRLVQINERGLSPWKVIRDEIDAWVHLELSGLIAAGVEVLPDGSQVVDSIAFDGDDEMFPIFQRNAFGNKFRNWSRE